ncbi:hypothetical protein A1O1_08163 [Capronia coronata CBS 617.96]|uniref:Cupin type-1 domain-containing protein n=1 Tax=Capronia coronata CBS 617.96 TaxID=1182541 RepID=W9YIG7_9EURO|nr:uncharacterized protein A1O1_08163 [Capronia coronata CBS 617.96]EXJ82094.1 hypothetical protein A1O1_08163 [Capronia coronata CBS 617.96]
MQVTQYRLPPTALMPNSPYPLLHYRGLEIEPKASKFYDLFSQNGWRVQWIYRYGETQRSHYHSSAHECMVVLSGTATIRFGVGDTSLDMDDNTYGPAREQGGVEIEARPGDVFLLPAGTAHKTYNTSPRADFTLLSPGDGHGIDAQDPRAALDQVPLSGFTMLGAYPEGSSSWDSLKGGEKNFDEFRSVWTVPKPERDPVLDTSPQGLMGLWPDVDIDLQTAEAPQRLRSRL